MTRRIKNQAIVELIDSPKDATIAFSSEVGDFQDSITGYIQAVYTGLTDFTGCFELFVSGICDPDTLARLPNSKICADPDCPSVGWNLTHIGWRFFEVRYTPNGESSGTIDRVIAIGKKG